MACALLTQDICYSADVHDIIRLKSSFNMTHCKHTHSYANQFNAHFWGRSGSARWPINFSCPFHQRLCVLTGQARTFHIILNIIHHEFLCLVSCTAIDVQYLTKSASSKCSAFSDHLSEPCCKKRLEREHVIVDVYYLQVIGSFVDTFDFCNFVILFSNISSLLNYIIYWMPFLIDTCRKSEQD